MSKAEFDPHYFWRSKKELLARYHEESIERFGALYEALAK
jgi:hypothetical protein